MIAVCCIVLMCGGVLQCVALYYWLQCVAVCCSVFSMCCGVVLFVRWQRLPRYACVLESVVQCVVMCCSVLQFVAV